MIKFTEFLEGIQVQSSSTCGGMSERPVPNKTDKKSTKAPAGAFNVHGNQSHDQ